MKKRTLIIAASVVVLLGLLVGAYYLISGSTPKLSTTAAPTFTQSGDQTPQQVAVTGPVQGAGTVVAPRLIRITPGPVAKGSRALPIKPEVQASSTSPELPDTEIRYVERASGNVYAFRVHDRVLTRIGNKTLPGALEASWLPDGSRVFVRFLSSEGGTEQVSTYALPASGGDGYFLPANLSSVGIVDQNTIVTLVSNLSGSVASTAALSGTGSKTLFSSPLSSITLAPAGKNFFATTKASAQVQGYGFLVSGSTGGFTKTLGPLSGLSTLPSPNGERVLYSYVYKGKLFTSVLVLASHTVTALPVATLSEKCAWAPDSLSIYCGVPTAVSRDLPDSWYQGVESFTDRLWHVDLSTRLATLKVDPSTVTGVRIDMQALTLDSESDVVVFTNKVDGSLWAYDL
jgi:hypothetical protein|tara:strand:+ start:483717 stop:484922 length:1206 start_codon:yes stop_codon:yes gene_type:complete